MGFEQLDELVGHPWREIELPPQVMAMPAMLSATERRLLYALGRHFASPDGAVVDAGCFLGGSTVALLSGLRDRRERWNGPPLHSYDLFRVEAYTIREYFADYPAVRVGDSFRGRFDANVAGFGVPHVVHEGDIKTIGWSGGPIDVLFLDVLKSWKLNDAVLRDFFPALVPGRSVIVHQDYGWGNMPWIPITVELMRDSLTFVDFMEGGSHVFLLEKEVPVELIENGLRGLSKDRQLELIERAIGRAEGWVRGMLEVDRAAILVDRDGTEAGLRELASIAERYADQQVVLLCVSIVREGLETDWTFGFAAAEPFDSHAA